MLPDCLVASALAPILGRPSSDVAFLMELLQKPILKARIPGSGRIPDEAMLKVSKRAVLRFFSKEQALGQQSDIVKAFYLAASPELHLRFDWAKAMARVVRAKFDRKRKIDKWLDAFAMSSGDSNAKTEIYVCGTRPITTRALTSLICHEGLHNLARRTRPGNPYLSEDTEHIAMALLGDPQLLEKSMVQSLKAKHSATRQATRDDDFP